jgi:hypothetical protein
MSEKQKTEPVAIEADGEIVRDEKTGRVTAVLFDGQPDAEKEE